jgi:hypothetical protein
MVRNSSKNGFVLVLVIMAIALVGMITYVLTDGAKTMIFQSDNAYLEACGRNLAASGVAWARQTSKERPAAIDDKPITLDVGRLNIREGLLSVLITGSQGQRHVQVSLSASRAHRRTTVQSTYLLD